MVVEVVEEVVGGGGVVQEVETSAGEAGCWSCCCCLCCSCCCCVCRSCSSFARALLRKSTVAMFRGASGNDRSVWRRSFHRGSSSKMSSMVVSLLMSRVSLLLTQSQKGVPAARVDGRSGLTTSGDAPDRPRPFQPPQLGHEAVEMRVSVSWQSVWPATGPESTVPAAGPEPLSWRTTWVQGRPMRRARAWDLPVEVGVCCW